MEENANDNFANTGLLDISVELSSEQIFAGSEFTVYVLLKNPFGRPLWVEEVSVSVPSQMYWQKEVSEKAEAEAKEAEEEQKRIDPELVERIAKHRNRVEQLHNEINDLQRRLQDPDSNDHDEVAERIKQKEQLLYEEASELVANEQHFYGLLNYEMVYALGEGTSVNIEEMRSSKPVVASSLAGGTVNITEYKRLHEQGAAVQLESSLPSGLALQPGSTAIWAIKLGTKSALFFLPSQYRLQFNVRYSFEKPPEQGEQSKVSRIFRVDTYAKQITIRASMQAIMLGAFVGGVAGSVARAVQVNTSFGSLLDSLSTIALQIILSSVLSVAAVIFAARKSDTQSFVSVEDFWGGAVIGFLVGFSGTTAFGQITGTQL
jgi:hypothetical protein